MRQKKKEPKSFKQMLGHYLKIKGLDIVVLLKNGNKVELYKNRQLIDDKIITHDSSNNERSILISQIESVDLFAA